MAETNILKYGIGGIRAKFGLFPMTARAILCLGRAIGVICREFDQTKKPQILVLSDTRASCKSVFKNLSSGLAKEKTGIIDCGILPTPAAPILLNTFKEASLAVVISASHNCSEFNGLKIFEPSGKLSVEKALQLGKVFNFFYKNTDLVNEHLGATTVSQKTTAKNAYVESIVSQFRPPDFSGVGTIGLDCANGAAFRVAPDIFKALDIKTKTSSTKPNGENINLNCGSTSPQALSTLVKNTSCTMGFSFDGDADRVIMCNAQGQIKDGDDFLAIMAQSSDFKSCKKVVGTVMSNSGLEELLNNQGKTLLRSQVGEANILNLMKSESCKLGGEPSGHMLLNNQAKSSDGIYNSLELLKTAKSADNLELKTFKKFFSKLINIHTKNKLPLESGIVAQTISRYNKQLNSGRIFPRYSQTEDLFRLLVETPEQALGEEISEKLNFEFEAIFNQHSGEKIEKVI